MRKKHKILAVLTAVATILVQLHLSSFAAGAESGAKLIFGDTTEPTAFYHNVNNNLRTVNGGAVYYYGYNRTDAKTNYGEGLFTDGWEYTCHGSGSMSYEYSWNSLQAHFPVFSEMSAEDAVYLSFWYRSHSEFADPNDAAVTLNGEETMPYLRCNNKNYAMYDLSCGKASGSDGCVTFKPDDKWRKVEYYIPAKSLTGSKNLQFWICMMQMNKACKIDFAGFTYALLDMPRGAQTSNDAYYTLISQRLNRGSLARLTVGGVDQSIKAGTTEYSVTADSTEVAVTAEGASGAKEPEVTKIDSFTYEITAYGQGIDDRVTEPMNYIERTDENGEYSADGTDKTFAVTNDDRMTAYTIHLEIKPVKATLLIDGQPTDSAEGCSDGSKISLQLSFRDFSGSAHEYISALMLMKDSRLLRAVPYYTAVAANGTATLDKTYTLEIGDYSGVTAKVMVFDKATFCEVLQ